MVGGSPEYTAGLGGGGGGGVQLAIVVHHRPLTDVPRFNNIKFYFKIIILIQENT